MVQPDKHSAKNTHTEYSCMHDLIKFDNNMIDTEQAYVTYQLEAGLKDTMYIHNNNNVHTYTQAIVNNEDGESAQQYE